MGTEGLPGRIDDPHLLISHFTQFFGKLLHIPVHPGLHVVVESKHAAFFQHTQTFQKQSLLVCAVDIMIDIVADHGVKSLVRKVQLPGIAIKEPAPFRYALAPGITLAHGLAVIVDCPPVIHAGHFRLRPGKRRPDGECTRSASHLQKRPLPVEIQVRQKNLMYFLHHAASTKSILSPDPVKPAKQDQRCCCNDERQNSDRVHAGDKMRYDT